MLTEQINGFIEYCKVSGFKNKSIQALTIRLNDFNEFLKSNRFFISKTSPIVIFRHSWLITKIPPFMSKSQGYGP